MRPVGGIAVEHAQRQRAQRVDLAATWVVVLAQREGRHVGNAHATRAEGQLQRGAVRRRADDRRREARLRRRPGAPAVETDLVGRRRAGLQAVQADEREVVALDLERALAMAEHVDLAGPVGLHPDRGLGRAGVAQHRAQDQLAHAGVLPAPVAGEAPGSDILADVMRRTWMLTGLAVARAGRLRRQRLQHAADDDHRGEATVTSSAFAAGGKVPAAYGCDGTAATAPALSWSGVPEGAKSLAIAVEDPDADGFVHWLVTGHPACHHERRRQASVWCDGVRERLRHQGLGAAVPAQGQGAAPLPVRRLRAGRADRPRRRRRPRRDRRARDRVGHADGHLLAVAAYAAAGSSPRIS